MALSCKLGPNYNIEVLVCISLTEGLQSSAVRMQVSLSSAM